ncbi:MAG: hypothetical protein WC812_00060 [Candidatus Pacearchaeota archaeon]|jgi:hypothetical protein
MRRGMKAFWFLLHLIFGLYLINVPIQFVKIPASFSVVNTWIIFVGGILVLFGGINYLRASRYSNF